MLELAKQTLLFGLPPLMMLVGLLSLAAEWRFRLTARKVRGKVVGYEERPDDEDSRRQMYQSVVEFDANGETHRIVDAASYGWKVDRPNGTVWVHYPADQPAEARILRIWYQLAYVSIFLAGATVLYLVFTRN